MHFSWVRSPQLSQVWYQNEESSKGEETIFHLFSFTYSYNITCVEMHTK